MELRITIEINDFSEDMPTALKNLLKEQQDVPFHLGFANSIGKVTAVQLDGEDPHVQVRVSLEEINKYGVFLMPIFVTEGELPVDAEKVNGNVACFVLDTEEEFQEAGE